MLSPTLDQRVKEQDTPKVSVYDDSMLFDQQPDPYDHDEGLSPSRFWPRSPCGQVDVPTGEPEAQADGSIGEPEPAQNQSSMSNGSLRRYREYIAQDTLQGIRGTAEEPFLSTLCFTMCIHVLPFVL